MRRLLFIALLFSWLLPTQARGATATLTGNLKRADGTACGSCSVVFSSPTTQVVDGSIIPKGRQFSFLTEADGDVPPGKTLTRTAVVVVEVQGDVRAQVSVPDQSSVDITSLIANNFNQSGLSLVNCLGPSEVLRFDLTSSSFTCATVSLNGDITDVWGCTTGNCNALVAASGDSINAEAADTTAPVKSGTAAPGTCQVGDYFFDTDATAGQNTFACTSVNTWTLQGGAGGGGAPTDATYITKTANGTLSAETAMGGLATGIVINTTTTGEPSIYTGTSCTNQLLRSLNASGAGTCSAVLLGSDVSGDLPLANFVQASAASRLLGRGGGAGAGDFEEISVGGILAFSGPVLNATEVDGSTSNEINTFEADSGGNTTGLAVTLAGGAGVDTSRSGNTVTLVVDATELGTVTWNAGSDFTWIMNSSSTTDLGLIFEKATDNIGKLRIAPGYLEVDNRVAIGNFATSSINPSGNDNSIVRIEHALTDPNRYPIGMTLGTYANEGGTDWNPTGCAGGPCGSLVGLDGFTVWSPDTGGHTLFSAIGGVDRMGFTAAGGTVQNVAARVIAKPSVGSGFALPHFYGIKVDAINTSLGGGSINGPLVALNVLDQTGSGTAENFAILTGLGVNSFGDTVLVRNRSPLRLLESGGADYLGFLAPASVTTPQTCQLEDDAHFIPDACVGNGSDADTTCNDAGVSCLFAGSASEGGPATTALALNANGGNCSAGEAAGGVDASGAAEACVDPIVNLGTDPVGTLPIANGGTGATSKTPAFDNLAPTTTSGDMIYYNGVDNVRLPVGTAGHFLAAGTPPSYVGLTKGSIFQGNSSGTPTAYPNPFGRDIRTENAACDGASDDGPEIQDCVDNYGTCVVPRSTNGCFINTQIVLGTNDHLLCEPGAEITLGSSFGTGTGTPAILITGTSNTSIVGCILNRDQVDGGSSSLGDTVRCTSDCEGFRFQKNQLWWNYDGDGASNTTEGFDHLEFDCKETAANAESCVIMDNDIYGSNNDGQNDRGINIAGGGGSFAQGTNVLIEANRIQHTGADAIEATVAASAAVVMNEVYGALDDGITGPLGQSVIGLNVVRVDSSAGGIALDVTGNNNRISFNNFPSNGGKGLARITDGSGTQFANNYSADGVHYVLSSPTSSFTNHPTINNNVFSPSACADDPQDIGTLHACIYMENPVDVSISSNTIVNTAFPGTDGGNAIRIVNRRTDTFDVKQVRLLNNLISLVGNGGNESCIELDDLSGAANNGFINVQLANNNCGDEGATAPDECLDLNGVSETANAADWLITSNIFDDCTTVTAGLPTGISLVAIGNRGFQQVDDTGSQTISAAGNTITCSRTVMHMSAGSAIGTLTSNPSIADGFDGQVCVLIYVNGATGSFTIPDGTTGVQLSAARAMAQNEILTVRYNSTIGDWVEQAWASN